MQFCRICRTDRNLKYTPKELRKLCKKQRKDGQQLLIIAPTLGNICHDCEERLQNFHTLDDIVGSDDLNASDRADTPIIVDDDELLYNLFLQKVEEQRKLKRAEENASLQFAPQHSLGSDGDTEIIEVLTSRESTPAPSQPDAVTLNALKSQDQKILAIIDLEADEDVVVPPSKPIESDDEEIVFHTVPEASPKITPGKSKKYRKTYAEKEMRLIASLSLVSSDSEQEELNNTSAPKVTKPAPAQPQVLNTTTAATNLTCEQCSTPLPTAQSRQQHECLSKDVKCPVCQLSFTCSQRLIQHMRRKHRSYDGEVLSERPRYSQDSAMTIRLRYMRRFTYYECQLCGRIDVVFKEHKEHVMQQHAAESKSLKDPMMKELKCFVCKEKCGTQHVQLCQHMLLAHSIKQCKPYMREVTHMRNMFSWNASRQQEVQRTARVFQFNKRKSYFFECKLCQKVAAGYLCHEQHMSQHSKVAIVGVPASKAPKSKKLKAESAAAEPKAREDKVKATANKSGVVSKKPAVPAPAPATAAAAPPAKKKQKLPRLSKKALKAALIKVKVKPPLRQFATQKYKCKYCAQTFKGYHRLNLHQIAAHSSEEYLHCSSCTRAFTSPVALSEHVAQAHDDRLPANRRTKRKRGSTPKLRNSGQLETLKLLLLDENCNTDCRRADTPTATAATHDKKSAKSAPATWLQDLQMLHAGTAASNPNDTALFRCNQQCLYCTHLFASAEELRAHEAEHEKRQEMQIIKRLTISHRPGSGQTVAQH